MNFEAKPKKRGPSQGRERYIFIHENNRLLTDSLDMVECERIEKLLR